MNKKYKLAIKLYKQGKSIKNISKELHISAKNLSNTLKLNNIPIRGYSSTTKVYNDDIIKKIINLYNNGNSIRDINKITKISRYNISYILKNNNINIKIKEYFNENYFKTINTEHKAYWLGLMYADGNISTHYSISLTLQKNDEYIIKKLCKDLEYEGNITYSKVKNKNNIGEYATLRIHSKKMFNDLSNKGCVQRKSNVLTFPNTDILPKELQRHFIRGYFDGDGCVSIDRNKTPSIIFQIVGTLNFATKVKEIIINEGFNTKANVIECTPNKLTKNPLYYFKVKGNILAIKIFDWLYKDTDLYLKRKYNKYITHKQYLTYCRLNSKLLKG